MKVTVEKNGQVIWERVESPPSGTMRRDDVELLEIISALQESIMQARANLSTFRADAVTDIGLVSLANVEGDVPVSRIGGSDPDGKTLVEPAIVPKRSPGLVALEVGVVGQQDIGCRS